jgi:hypothetical protein
MVLSFQSVTTSADAGPASPVSMTTGTTQRRFGNMAISVSYEDSAASTTTRSGPQIRRAACAANEVRRGEDQVHGFRQ